MPLATTSDMDGPAGVPKPVGVLVGDPDAAARAAVRAQLLALDPGLVIHEAESGEEALALIEAHEIGLVYVDVRMRGISGVEAVRLARLAGARPFLVLTAEISLPNWALVATDLFAYEFLTKPISEADVAATLRAYRRSRSVARVLLVDPAEPQRAIVRKVLSYSRFATEIAEADTTQEAVALATERPFDLALVDGTLGGVGALETAYQLQRCREGLTAVLVTSSEDKSLLAALRQLQIGRWMRKPFFTRDYEGVLLDAFGLPRPHLMKAVFATEKRIARAASEDASAA